MQIEKATYISDNQLECTTPIAPYVKGVASIEVTTNGIGYTNDRNLFEFR